MVLKYFFLSSHLGSNTKSMWNHIKAKHPAATPRGDTASAGPAKMAQPTIVQAIRKPQMSTSKLESCHRHLALMCARDLRPLSIVEGDGFRGFVHAINADYKLPTRKTIKLYLTRIYEEEKGELIDTLKGVDKVSLTSDLWTSNAQEGYITVTCHYINGSWELCHEVLTTRRFHERHTAINIAQEFKAIVAEFGIREVACVVTDNAANIKLAVGSAGWEGSSCFAHTLQLCVEDGLKLDSVSRAVGAARRLVGHFSHSVLACDALKAKQISDGVQQPLKLIQACPTRWNSTYAMLERLLKLRVPVYAVLFDDTVTKAKDRSSLDVPDSFWHTMETILPVLQPLAQATEVLGKEDVPTGSSVYVMVHGLMTTVLAPSDLDTKVVTGLKQRVRDGLMARMQVDSNGRPAADVLTSPQLIASFLDPRYKGLLPGIIGQAGFESLKSHVLRLAEEGSTSPSLEGLSPVVKMEMDAPSSYSSPKSIFDIVDGEVVDLTSAEDSVASEVDAFISSVRARGEVKGPLQWWRTKSVDFPTLAKLARSYLAIPGSSIPSERAFSAAGLTLTKLRASLEADTADKLLFVNKRYNRKRKLTVESSTCVNDDSPKRKATFAQGSPAAEDALRVRVKAESDNDPMPPLPTLPTL